MLSDREILNLHSAAQDSYGVKSLAELGEFIRTRIREVFPHKVAVCSLVETTRTRLLKMINVDFPAEHLRTFVLNDGKMHGLVETWLRHQSPLLVRLDQRDDTVDSVWASSARKFNIRSAASHGVLDLGGSFFSYFCFGEVHASVQEQHKEYLNFLIPFLHVVLVRELSRARERIDERLTSKEADTHARSPRVNDPGVRHALTQRERQILNWVSIGKTNWEISRIIDVSENTVKNHVQSIYKKLGVKNRTQAAGKAVSFAAEVAMSPHFDRSDYAESSSAFNALPLLRQAATVVHRSPSPSAAGGAGLDYSIPVRKQGHTSGKLAPVSCMSTEAVET